MWANGSYFVQSKRSLLLVKQSFTVTYVVGLYHRSILSGFLNVTEKGVHQWLLITTCKKCDQPSKDICHCSLFIVPFKSSLQRSRSGGVTQCWGAMRDTRRPERLRRRLVQESHVADIPTYSEKLLLYEQGTLLPYLVEFQFCDNFPCNR